MVKFKLSSALLSALVIATCAAPTDLAVPDKRGSQVLSDGNSVVVGSLLDWSLIFRTSGYLDKGGCPASSSITTCYVMKLSSDPQENLDPNLGDDPTLQSSFVSTSAQEATGAITKYTFKLFIDPSLQTPSSSEFPIVQVVSKEAIDGQGSATKVFLDVRGNKAGIYAFSDTPVVSVPLSLFTGKTLLHTWAVKGGVQGWADIEIRDAESNTSILEYRVDKPNILDSYRMRIGPIRSATDALPYIAYFGDWNARPVVK